KMMLRLASERDQLRVVADQHGCPTATADIAEAILQALPALTGPKAPWGTYHFAAPNPTTWHGFASEILPRAARYTGRRPPVEAIATADYPTPARRPANSVLDSSRYIRTFGYRALDWQTRTGEIVDALLSSAAPMETSKATS